MKKKYWIFIAAGLLLLALIPIPTGIYKDGGTRVYQALTYKIVDWNRMYGDGTYNETRVYLIPDCWRSIDSLWTREEENAAHTLRGTVKEIHGDSVTVTANDTIHIGDFSFSITDLEALQIETGTQLRIAYMGNIQESDPAQISAVSWELDMDHRPASFQGEWLNGNPETGDDLLMEDVFITEIYADCFFATPVIPMPYTIKVNGVLPEEWCLGDQVKLTYANQKYDHENYRGEGELLSIEPSDFELEPGVAYKPVIYLYPEQKTEVSVRLQLNGHLTCTYPAYQDGWRVTAAPNGTLTDAAGMTYNYLYWEGKTDTQYDFSEGFCVPGKDTAAFLEQALHQLGLTRREANEFIVYWLPQMEANAYNVISFQQERYTQAAKLNISPEPDTLIRVFMAWKPSDAPAEIPPQALDGQERTGFTVVEWGGTKVLE